MATGWKSSYRRYKQVFLNISAQYKKRADLRAFLEIILSISVVIIFSLFAIKPTALTIIDLIEQIKVKKQTITDLNNKISSLEKANIFLSQNRGSVEGINIAVASAPSPDIFTKQIQALSSKDNVVLTALSINEIVLVGTPKTERTSKETNPLPEKSNEMEYSISFKGNYVDINAFLTDLKNLKVVNTIDALTITSSVNDVGRVITATVTGRVPYLGSNK